MSMFSAVVIYSMFFFCVASWYQLHPMNVIALAHISCSQYLATLFKRRYNAVKPRQFYLESVDWKRMSMMLSMNQAPDEFRIRVILLETLIERQKSLAHDLLAFTDIHLVKTYYSFQEVMTHLDHDMVDLVLIDPIARPQVKETFFDVRKLRWLSPNTHVLAIQGEADLTLQDRATLLAGGVMECLEPNLDQEYLYHAIHRCVREQTVVDSALASFIHQHFVAEGHAQYLTGEEKTLLTRISHEELAFSTIADETNTRHLGNILLKFSLRFGGQVEQNLQQGVAPFTLSPRKGESYSNSLMAMPHLGGAWHPGMMGALMYTPYDAFVSGFRDLSIVLVEWVRRAIEKDGTFIGSFF